MNEPMFPMARCLKCGHTWQLRKKKPKQCPGCTCRKWDCYINRALLKHDEEKIIYEPSVQTISKPKLEPIEPIEYDEDNTVEVFTKEEPKQELIVEEPKKFSFKKFVD